MNIFITGGGGFIGMHLKEYFQEKYPTYKLFCPSSKELNLVDESAVDKFMHKNKINIIIHLANRGGDKAAKQMDNIVEYNLRIFFNLVKHLKGLDKFLSFGSGAEYGKNRDIIDVKEDLESPFAPDSYGFYKQIIAKYATEHKNIIHLRIFGVYGEYEDYRYKFISNSIVKNLLKLPIKIFQNVVFDYIYIKDLLKMIDYVFHNSMQHKIYNLSGGRYNKIDLFSLANMVNDCSEFKSKIILLNDGFNNEYSSNNDRILQEMSDFAFTSHKVAISNIMRFYIDNFNSIDKESVLRDFYLKDIQRKGVESSV